MLTRQPLTLRLAAQRRDHSLNSYIKAECANAKPECSAIDRPVGKAAGDKVRRARWHSPFGQRSAEDYKSFRKEGIDRADNRGLCLALPGRADDMCGVGENLQPPPPMGQHAVLRVLERVLTHGTAAVRARTIHAPQ